MKHLIVQMELVLGAHIEDVLPEALQFAKVNQVNVKFIFNEVPVYITPDSDITKELDKYWNYRKSSVSREGT